MKDQIDWVSICMKLTEGKYNVWHIPWHGKYILINIELVSKHSVTILGLRVVTPAGLEPG